MHSSEPRILRIELPPGLPLLNMNDRPFLRKNKKGQRIPSNSDKIVQLRDAAELAARQQSFMPFTKVRIRCIFRAPDNRKRDTFNLASSFKACIDGIVRAGVIKDDNDSIVKEVSIVRGENYPKLGQLIIQVIEETV